MHPRIRSRNRAIVAFLVSLAVFLPALVVPRAPGTVPMRTMLLVFCLAAMLFSAIWLVIVWDIARRVQRLQAGEGVLARWTIDAARWAWFRHHSGEWDRREGVRRNDVDFTQTPGPHGIEVVVTRDGIQVGADFHPLEKTVRIAAHADWMEFHDVIPKADGAPMHLVLRLPLEAGREGVAADIVQGYGQVRASGLGRGALLLVALGIFVGLPAVTALAWWVARLTGWVA